MVRCSISDHVVDSLKEMRLRETSSVMNHRMSSEAEVALSLHPLLWIFCDGNIDEFSSYEWSDRDRDRLAAFEQAQTACGLLAPTQGSASKVICGPKNTSQAALNAVGTPSVLHIALRCATLNLWQPKD